MGVRHTSAGAEIVDTKSGEILRFDAAEWTAFVAGVKNGEFDIDPLRATDV